MPKLRDLTVMTTKVIDRSPPDFSYSLETFLRYNPGVCCCELVDNGILRYVNWNTLDVASFLSRFPPVERDHFERVVYNNPEEWVFDMKAPCWHRIINGEVLLPERPFIQPSRAKFEKWINKFSFINQHPCRTSSSRKKRILARLDLSKPSG